MMALNTQIVIFLNQLVGRSAFASDVVIFIASKLDILVLVAVILLLLREGFLRQRQSQRLVCFQCYEHLLVTLIIACSARALAELIKALTQIPRPFMALPDQIYPLFTTGGLDSFPSGHATLFFGLAVGVYRHKKSWGIMLGILALLISVSRVIAGVHYPIDIITGALLGLIVGGIALLLDQKLFHKKG